MLDVRRAVTDLLLQRCGRPRTEIATRRFGKALESLVTKAAIDLANAPHRESSGESSSSAAAPSDGVLESSDGSESKRRPRKSRQQGWSLFHKDNDESADDEKAKLEAPATSQYTRVLPTIMPRAIFFMVDNASMMPWNSRLGKSVILMRDLCDERFYYNMRWEFWRHRGWLKSLFSLHTFAGCDFYQVSTLDIPSMPETRRTNPF